MKKTAAIICAFACLLALLAGCAGVSSQSGGQAQGAGVDGFLVGKTAQKAQLIAEMAASDDYISIVGSLQPETVAVIKQYAGLGAAAPRKAYVLHITGTQTMERTLTEEGANLTALSGELADATYNRMYTSFPHRVNAMIGVNHVAAASLLSVGGACQKPAGLGGPAIVILVYEEAVAVACVFTESEDNTLVMSGMPMVADEDLLAALESSGQSGTDGGVWAPFVYDMDVKVYVGSELRAMLPS